MTKEEVKKVFKTGDGKKISDAVKSYFKETRPKVTKESLFEEAKSIFNGREIPPSPQQVTML